MELNLEIRTQDREAAADLATQLRFERSGFLRAPEILDRDEVSALRTELERMRKSKASQLAALRHQVRVQQGVEAASACQTARDCKTRLRPFERNAEVSFLQYFNLHRDNPVLRRIALSPRLGYWARQLLGSERVRLYQDALFVKRPGDGPTRWHSDLGLAPFDTNDFVTVWLAITPVPRFGGSGLCFAVGSHRDFALPYHGDPEEDLQGRYEVEGCGELRPGDATFHHGWTLHSADGLPESAPARLAWTVSYVADGARLLRLRPGAVVEEEEDAVSFEPWIGDVRGGAAVDHPMVPLVPIAS